MPNRPLRPRPFSLFAFPPRHPRIYALAAESANARACARLAKSFRRLITPASSLEISLRNADCRSFLVHTCERSYRESEFRCIVTQGYDIHSRTLGILSTRRFENLRVLEIFQCRRCELGLTNEQARSLEHCLCGSITVAGRWSGFIKSETFIISKV